MAPKGFNYNIDDGMMYVKVALAKVGFGGMIIGIEKERIVYDRIPLQEYLKGLLKKQ